MNALELLAHARKYSRFDVVYDDLDPDSACRIKRFCALENLPAKIELDANPLRWKISVSNLTLDAVEKLDALLGYEQRGQ